MIKVGITGGIGSGKSVVASLLALSGIPVYIADEESKQVNQIIHPEVNRHFSAWVERQTSPLCAIESAILFESGFYKVVDISLMVYAPRELRIERALGRDSASREEIERRINSQMSDEEKKDRSDYVIYNDNRQALIPQVGKLLCWLQSQ